MGPLGSLAPEEFLRTHWQVRPLFVSGALAPPPWAPEPGDLAAVACAPGAEARLVLESGGSRPWEVRHGPFDPDELAALPASGWSLLVHRLEERFDAAAELLDRFRFLPNWRIDDAMASHAPPGGSVGAHVDAYDVFLIQLAGRRRWSIEHAPREDPVWRPDADVRILERFAPDETRTLAPGDLLYLPPGIPHHGVALEDCVTLSIGFRAPSRDELVAAWAADRLAEPPPAERFADPGRTLPASPGRIAEADLARFRAWIRAETDDGERLDRWIASRLTRGGDDDPADDPDAEARGEPPSAGGRAAALAGPLRRSRPSHFGWLATGGDGVELFVGGRHRPLPSGAAGAARALCDDDRLDARRLLAAAADGASREALARLLAALVEEGFLLPPDDGA